MVIEYRPVPKSYCFCIDGSTDEDFLREIVNSGEVVVEARYYTKTTLSTSLYTAKHSRRLNWCPKDCTDLKFHTKREICGLDCMWSDNSYFKLLKKQGKKEYERFLTSALKQVGLPDTIKIIIQTDVKELANGTNN